MQQYQNFQLVVKATMDFQDIYIGVIVVTQFPITKNDWLLPLVNYQLYRRGDEEMRGYHFFCFELRTNRPFISIVNKI